MILLLGFGTHSDIDITKDTHEAVTRHLKLGTYDTHLPTGETNTSSRVGR